MRRFETLANRVLDVPMRDLAPLLDSLSPPDLVAVLAGIRRDDDHGRYRKNVVATALLNRLGARDDLLREALVPPRVEGLGAFTSALARAVGMDVACVDEVDGDHFLLHGKHDVPEGLAGVERCRQSSMAMCQAVLTTGLPVVVPDLTQDPVWCGVPAWTKFGLRSYAAAPGADAEGNVAVVVWMASYRPRTFAPSELFMLERVAQRIAREMPARPHPYPSRLVERAAPDEDALPPPAAAPPHAARAPTR